MTTLLEKYIAKIEGMKVPDSEIPETIGAGQTQDALRIGKDIGYNNALKQVQSLLPELIKEVVDACIEVAKGGYKSQNPDMAALKVKLMRDEKFKKEYDELTDFEKTVRNEIVFDLVSLKEPNQDLTPDGGSGGVAAPTYLRT